MTILQGTTTIDVINPSTLVVVESVPATDPADLDGIVRASEAHQVAWAQRSPQERRALLAAAVEELQKDVERIAALLTAEQGKPLGDARQEVGYAIHGFRHFSTMADDEQWVEGPGRRTLLVRQPLGVVGAIVPWNWPLALFSWKVGPALMAGNSIIVKPAPTTPLSTIAMLEAMERVLPLGLITLVHGGAELGNAMVTHPGIAKISFTGSTPTGKAIMEAAGSTLKRLTLELGGNDAAVLLPDVDLDDALPRIFRMGFNNAGQTCVAVKRVYVPAALEQEVADRLLDFAAAMVVGDGMDAASQMGPLHLESQLRKVEAMLADAQARGGITRAPGAPIPDLPGWYMRPTVVTGIQDDAVIVAQEQFGPALPVLSYGSVEEVIQRANGAEFDLGASVWGADTDAATLVAERLNAGSVWVNQHAAMDVTLPFGGLRFSGIGEELGPNALNEYSATKIVNVRV